MRILILWSEITTHSRHRRECGKRETGGGLVVLHFKKCKAITSLPSMSVSVCARLNCWAWKRNKKRALLSLSFSFSNSFHFSHSVSLPDFDPVSSSMAYFRHDSRPATTVKYLLLAIRLTVVINFCVSSAFCRLCLWLWLCLSLCVCVSVSVRHNSIFHNFILLWEPLWYLGLNMFRLMQIDWAQNVNHKYLWIRFIASQHCQVQGP